MSKKRNQHKVSKEVANPNVSAADAEFGSEFAETPKKAKKNKNK